MDDLIHGKLGSEGTFESGVFGDQGWVWYIRPSLSAVVVVRGCSVSSIPL